MYEIKEESISSHILMTIVLGMKSLVYSKKWFIYVLLSLAPFLFSVLSANKLGLNSSGQQANGLEAFISVTMNMQFGFFYVFGVLLLALPFTSDEITDHVMDLFLLRPVHKQVIFFTRYFLLVLANTIINGLLVIFYYIYYYYVDNRNMIDGLGVLGNVILFFIIANLLYFALFLGIGFLGSKGFGIGVFVAIIELFFLSFLFLTDDALVPRTNLKIIAHNLLGTNFSYNGTSNFIPSLSSVNNAYLYILVVTIAFLAIGFLYFKRRDFD